VSDLSTDEDVEARLATVRRIVGRSRTHAGSARTEFNAAVKSEQFEDHVDQAQTLAQLAAAEALAAASSLLLMFVEIALEDR
jgi:hypothetical protein